MGICLCKSGMSEDNQPESNPLVLGDSNFDDSFVNDLIKDLLNMIISYSYTSQALLANLKIIAETDKGWMQMILSIIVIVPTDNPFGMSVITPLLDECPLPQKSTVVMVTRMFNLSLDRVLTPHFDINTERNICIMLGTIANKHPGETSIQILTENMLEYLFAIMHVRCHPGVTIMALIALEKLSQTSENCEIIRNRFEQSEHYVLTKFEKSYDSLYGPFREIGFAARWYLDNMFPVQGRTLSHETVDFKGINVVLDQTDMTEYLKLSPDGLEARNDSTTFESVRSTFKFTEGVWFYECLIVTPGVMQIGFATKNCQFKNHDGLGVGDDDHSIAYDGCRKFFWHQATPSDDFSLFASWKSGDILGCLLDLNTHEVKYSINGNIVYVHGDVMTNVGSGVYAAASLMAFQQCRFNFGNEPYQFPPDTEFSSFNDHGTLTKEQMEILPKRVVLERLKNITVNEKACTICFDKEATCKLGPCGHDGFCDECVPYFKECPLCRGQILQIDEEDL